MADSHVQDAVREKYEDIARRVRLPPDSPTLARNSQPGPADETVARTPAGGGR
jgi:hypothetical protein